MSKHILFSFGEIEQIKNEVNKCKVLKKRKTALIPMSNHISFLASGKSSRLNFLNEKTRYFKETKNSIILMSKHVFFLVSRRNQVYKVEKRGILKNYSINSNE